MDNRKKENRSMYLYTALIFVVALLLILVAFFSQTNISRLGKRAEEFATAAPVTAQPVTTQAPAQDTSELAKLANMAAELDRENENLKAQLDVADILFTAISYVKNGQLFEAEEILLQINADTLTDNQKILFSELTTKINQGKEQ